MRKSFSGKFICSVYLILLHLVTVIGIIVIFSCSSEQKNNGDVQAGVKLISDTLNWSLRMADSEIYRRGESLKFGGTDPKAKWNYQTGLFLKSVLELWETNREPKYLLYVQDVINSFVDDSGRIQTYKMEDFNIDKINSGKVLLQLFDITGNPKYKSAADLLRQQLQLHPRTREGGFWHKKIYPWQMWLDGIYMGAPFYARYSLMFDQPEGFDDVAKQILLIDSYTRDPKTGLRYHGWDESNKMAWADPETGCSPNFWGRAMGWYAMALVDVLDFLPEKHQKRTQIIYILNDLVQAIAKYQDQDSGLWYQVLDQAGREGNYLEASASCMFVYALAKATRLDYVNSNYRQVAEKAYNGILQNMIRTDVDGLVNITQVCSVAGLGGDPYRDGSYGYYLSEPVVENDLKGVGPFILASLEMEKVTAY